MRYRAIFDGQGLKAEIENDEVVYWRPETTPDNRSDLPTPGLIRDQIDPFKSMADGKLYDSKSAYRETLKARGLTEIGNDTFRPPPPPVKKNTRRELLSRQLGDMSDRQANKLLKQLKKGA